MKDWVRWYFRPGRSAQLFIEHERYLSRLMQEAFRVG